MFRFHTLLISIICLLILGAFAGTAQAQAFFDGLVSTTNLTFTTPINGTPLPQSFTVGRIYYPVCTVSTARAACPTADEYAYDLVTGYKTYYALVGTLVPVSVGGYNITSFQVSSNVPWLYVIVDENPASNGGTTPGSVTVFTMGSSGLSAGTYNGNITLTSSQASSPFVIPVTLTVAPTSPTYTSYFPHLAFGGGWQSTITYVNYSPQSVSCTTMFYADSGAAMPVPFGGTPVSSRTDALAPGAVLHQQTVADVTAATTEGWATASCSGPLQASLLFRDYDSQGVAQGEAGVNATLVPAMEFVTFAQAQNGVSTGIAYANPSSTSASITVTALNSSGQALGSVVLPPLAPNAHGAANVGPLLGLNSFTGSVQIVSTVPIISLSLNAEAFPVFSALPPGDLPNSTPLAPGH